MAVLVDALLAVQSSDESHVPGPEAAAGASLGGSLPQEKKITAECPTQRTPACPEGICKMPLKCSYLIFPETRCH